MLTRDTISLRSLALLAAVAGATIALPAITPVVSASPRAAAELPTVDAIYEHCVKAVGGHEALDKVKTLRAKSTMSMMGMSMQAEQCWSRDGGRMMKMNMGGESILATDGKTAWMKSPMGYMLAPEDQAEQLEMHTGMHMFMMDFKNFAKDMKNLEVVGEEEFHGKKCYKVNFAGEDENEKGSVYFDVESGLPEGIMHTMSDEDAGSTDTATMLLSDWKDVSGVKFFHLVTMEIVPGENSQMSGMTDPDGKIRGEIKFSTIEVNALADNFFELPAEVKKLVADQPKADEDAPTSTPADNGASPEIKLQDLPADQQAEAQKLIEGAKRSGQVAQTLPFLEASIDQMDPSRRKMMEFVVQELRKEVKSGEGSPSPR